MALTAENFEDEYDEEEERNSSGVGLDITRMPWPDDDDESD